MKMPQPALGKIPTRNVEIDDDGAGLDIRALFRFFLRRQWIMICVGALTAALFVGFTMTQTPRFTGVALVMISPKHGDIVENDPAAQSDINPDAGTIESQIEIIMARKLIGQLVDRLNMVKDPAWNGALKPKGPLDTALSFIRGEKPGTPTLAQTRLTREQVVDAVAASMSARRKGLTYVIEVSASSPDATQAARMANGLVALYFESQLKARYDASQKANAWLSARLTSLKSEVQQKEAAVEAYRAQTGLLTAQGASLTEQQITGLQGSVIAAKTDVAERQARYQQVQSIIRAGGSADSIAAVINSGTISSLRAQEADAARRQADLENRYGELHPSIAAARQERAGIQAQIKAEVARISENLRNEVDVAQARLNTLVGNQNSVEQQMVTNNSGMVKLRELERDAFATRAIYEAFLKRYQEISESVSLEVTDAQMVGEAAVPTHHSSPRLGLALLIGIVLGGCFGLGSGLVVEFMDEGLDDAKSVEATTGKQVLASIPIVRPEGPDKLPFQDFRAMADGAVRIASLRDLTSFLKHGAALMKRRVAASLSKHNGPKDASEQQIAAPVDLQPDEWNPATYLVERPMSAFAEGFRSLRTSLLYSGLDRQARTIAITSAMPGEGKTTTSVCLARVSGLSGQKVIVVDCDLRRRSLTTIVGVPAEKGLLQVLKGEVGWQDVVSQDAATGISILPSSAGSFTPWDVFGSAAMQSLLNDLTEAYDLIILDCPPVLAVAETRIICGLADQTVLVVRWAHTPARAAHGAIDQIEHCGGFVGGVTVNCVDPNAPGRGGYGDATYQARYAGEYYAS